LSSAYREPLKKDGNNGQIVWTAWLFRCAPGRAC